MKEFIQLLNKKMEEAKEESRTYKDGHLYSENCAEISGLNKAIKIVNELADDYNNGWRLCSEELPSKYCHCLVTRRNDYEDGGFDTDVREDCWIELEGVWDWQSNFEGLIDNVIAWQPFPKPYKPNN